MPDWKEAEKRLEEKEESYRELLKMPNCNPMFVIGILASLKLRFEKGERTQSLYDEIMELE